jgi:hypothetical protein
MPFKHFGCNIHALCKRMSVWLAFFTVLISVMGIPVTADYFMDKGGASAHPVGSAQTELSRPPDRPGPAPRHPKDHKKGVLTPEYYLL